ncbi:3-isopropylmalate dehydratase [Desulfosporosinus sp. PR]|uniref:LeuD/DmdB family oxidoreductase small subunit n=1 Tax=Candidatus Desulfosporosinus nitrosoreducens TaxID=3401928 RepID=UPI0027E62124|nr:3-isopropylmalate dehydratase [Desulfosporosinus sp. PR]MDQ7094860.1 3-isopropylmalate dehydratase [Desulfosporosinus sp. PR]
MNRIFEGRVWKLGDDIDTDIIIPTQFLAFKSVEDMKKYTFSPLRPDLSELIKPGDIVVAGRNFGCGSSREQAPEILAALKLSCIIAKSYARIFYRNAFNNGLLLFENMELYDSCQEGDILSVNLETNKILLNNKSFNISSIPENLLQMVEAGGLVSFMKKRNVK